MKTIGLLGGMSWESSAEYYRIINQTVRDRLGDAHSALSVMVSLDFGEIKQLQHAGEWDHLTGMMVQAAKSIERGGADFVVICCNTMHRMANDVESNIGIPLLHIADPTARQIVAAGLSRVGLIGSAFTMEQDFYRRRLEENFGLEVIIPDDAGRARVHRVIYDELISGIIREESREAYRQVIAGLVDRGAEAVILGCTEIMLLVAEADSAVPLFDTATIHALAAVDQALA
jgi:aspartate racemase